MTNVLDHDILKTKEDVHENLYNESYVCFAPGAASTGKDTYSTGCIFLSLRRRKIVKVELAGKSFSRTFDEIVLSPDGRVGVLERTRSSRIA